MREWKARTLAALRASDPRIEALVRSSFEIPAADVEAARSRDRDALDWAEKQVYGLYAGMRELGVDVSALCSLDLSVCVAVLLQAGDLGDFLKDGACNPRRTLFDDPGLFRTRLALPFGGHRITAPQAPHPVLDPFLGLRHLVGAVSYAFLQAKPEWQRTLPHLPAIVLLGANKGAGAAAAPCDVNLSDPFTKELGGTHSFLQYLDTHPVLSRVTLDFVYEFWTPSAMRVPRAGSEDRLRGRVVPGGPLGATVREFVACEGAARHDSCALKHVRVHGADLRAAESEYWSLLQVLLTAMEKSQPEIFLTKCTRLFLDWEPEEVVQSLLSLSPLEDLSNPHLAHERLAHEFRQLPEAVRHAVLTRLGAMHLQRYPYDLVGAVNTWLRTGGEERPVHPFVLMDVKEIVTKGAWHINRHIMAMDIYALCRLLKEQREQRGPRLGVFFAGAAHSMVALYLLLDMYAMHGAAASLTGCLDFASPVDAPFAEVQDLLLQERREKARLTSVLYIPSTSVLPFRTWSFARPVGSDAVAMAGLRSMWTELCSRVQAWRRRAVASGRHMFVLDAFDDPDWRVEDFSTTESVIWAQRYWAKGVLAQVLPGDLQDRAEHALLRRFLAAALVESPVDVPWTLDTLVMRPEEVATRRLFDYPALWARRTLFPPWSTAIVPGARMDPYLGMTHLPGAVSYVYMEPKLEWARRLPHLPVVVLVGAAQGEDAPGLEAFLQRIQTLPLPLSNFSREVLLQAWKTRYGTWEVHPELRGGPVDRLASAVAQGSLSLFLNNMHVEAVDMRLAHLTHSEYYPLLVHLAEAVESASPSHFLAECWMLQRTSQDPKWDAKRILQSLLSLDVQEDLAMPTDGRPLASMFRRLPEEVQAEVRMLLDRLPEQSLPYDLAGALNTWLFSAQNGQHVHPFVETDLMQLLDEMDTQCNRRLMMVELTALSHLLQSKRLGMGVFIADHVHCIGAAYLLQNMYNIHGAALSTDGVSVDFSKPTDDVFRDSREHVLHALHQERQVPPVFQEPVVWEEEWELFDGESESGESFEGLSESGESEPSLSEPSLSYFYSDKEESGESGESSGVSASETP